MDIVRIVKRKMTFSVMEKNLHKMAEYPRDEMTPTVRWYDMGGVMILPLYER